MTPDPVTVTENTPLEAIVKLMEKRRIKRVPVVRGVYVVGLISRANLLHALATVSHAIKPAEQTDEAIRALLDDPQVLARVTRHVQRARAELHHAAFVHHDDPIRNLQRPFLVVCNEDTGDVQVSVQQDGAAVLLRLKSGTFWRLRADGAQLSLEETIYLGGIEPRRGEQVVLTGFADGPQHIKWALSKVERAG